VPYIQMSEGIRDSNDQPISFSIDTDHVFAVTARDEQSESGWRKTEVPLPIAGEAKAQAFAVSQNKSGDIRIALAVGEKAGSPSRLFIAGPFSPDPNETDWSRLRPVWTPRMIQKRDVTITRIIMGTDDDYQGPPLIIVATTERAGKTPKHYRISSDPNDDDVEWFPKLEGADEIYDIRVGALPQARGAYSLYRVGNEYSLEFEGVPDPEYDVSFLTSLNVPPGALTLSPQINDEGYTDLYVKGNGEYLFTADNQSSGATADKLADEVDTATVKISSRSSLTEDYKPAPHPQATTKMVPYQTYRTCVSFPPDVAYADIWASEEVTIETQGNSYTIDPVRPVRLRPNPLGKLVINLPAEDLVTPTLRVHTNTMLPYSRYFVCPDVEVHKKIAALEDGALYGARDDLGIDPGLGEQDCDHVQKTLQSMTKSIQYTYNTTPDGVHHDRAVLPTNLDDVHFMLEFGGADGNARYKPLSKPEVQHLTRGATVIDQGAAQGFFDEVGHFFEEAGTIIVHTAERVGGDIVGTVKKVGDDTILSVERFGEDLVHGDLFAAADDLVQGGENIGRDLFAGAANVVEDVLKGEGQLLVVTLKYADKALQFVLTHTGLVGRFLGWIFQKIGAALDKVLQWLLYEIGWDDVLHTHDVLVDSFDNGIEAIKQYIRTLQQQADNYFASLEDEVREDVDAALGAIGVEQLQKPTSTPDGFSEAVEKLEWLFSKAAENVDSSTEIPLPAMAAATSGPVGDFLGVLERELGPNGEKLLDDFTKSFDYIERFFSGSGSTPELLLGAVLEFAKAMALTALKVTSAIIDAVMDLVEEILESLKEAVNAAWEIPFLSDLYHSITKGRDLTVLSLTALLIATPVTLMYKASFGEAPFKDSGALALSLDELHPRVRAWAHVYTGAQFVLAEIAAAQDAKAYSEYQPGQTEVEAFDKWDGMLTASDLIANLLTQIVGNPLGFPDPALFTKRPPPREKYMPIRAPNYWEHVIWDVQWGGMLFSLVFMGDGLVSAYRKAKPRLTNRVGPNVLAFLNCALGVVYMGLMSTLDVADRKKHDRIAMVYKNHNNSLWTLPPEDILYELEKEGLPQEELDQLKTELKNKSKEELDEEVEAVKNYFAWASDEVGGGIPAKGFGNIMDTFPDIGQLGVAPVIADLTGGWSLIGTVAFDVVGHWTEAMTVLARTNNDALL
jgi:hypothetical protein